MRNLTTVIASLRTTYYYVTYICIYAYICTILYYKMLTEFRANGNWGYNVPVHPGLSLHQSQPSNYHAYVNLYITGKLWYTAQLKLDTRF